MSEKIYRLLRILNHLNNKEPLTLETLAQEFHVTDRTIYRYIKVLRSAGFRIDFDDENVNEQDDYPKLRRERECNQAVNKLVRVCKSTEPLANAPIALARACDEYNMRIKPLVNQA